MISFLSGTLVATTLDSAIIDVHDVGYQVLMSSKSLSRLGMVGEKVRVLTHLQLRDDALVLYGFLVINESFCIFVKKIGYGRKICYALDWAGYDYCIFGCAMENY